MLTKKVKDLVTGFTGIVISSHKKIGEPERFEVQPAVNEKGEIPETQWFCLDRIRECQPEGSSDTSNAGSANAHATAPLLNYNPGTETLFDGLKIPKDRVDEILKQMEKAFEQNKDCAQNSDGLFVALAALVRTPEEAFFIGCLGGGNIGIRRSNSMPPFLSLLRGHFEKKAGFSHYSDLLDGIMNQHFEKGRRS